MLHLCFPLLIRHYHIPLSPYTFPLFLKIPLSPPLKKSSQLHSSRVSVSHVWQKSSSAHVPWATDSVTNETDLRNNRESPTAAWSSSVATQASLSWREGLCLLFLFLVRSHFQWISTMSTITGVLRVCGQRESVIHGVSTAQIHIPEVAQRDRLSERARQTGRKAARIKLSWIVSCKKGCFVGEFNEFNFQRMCCCSSSGNLLLI